jgi:hypothetical protein
MGQAQSTHTTTEVKELPCKEEISPPSSSSVSGRIVQSVEEENVNVEAPQSISSDEESNYLPVAASDDGYDESSEEETDSDDEEEDEYKISNPVY